MSKAIYSLDEIIAAGEAVEISSTEDLENVLLEQVQQAQEVIALVEEEDFVEAREQIEGIERRLNAVKAYILALEAEHGNTNDD